MAASPLRIAVVIPVKDDAEPLQRCLTALARQTKPPDQIIIVDNNSTDSTPAVALDAHVRVLSETHPGIAAASAAGYDAATTDLIARLDADSLPSDRWVASILDAFTRHPGIGAVTGPATFTDGPRWLRTPAAIVYLGLYYALVATALGHLPVFGSNFALRADVWRDIRTEVHRDDTLMHDDMDLAIHIGPTRRIRFEPRMSLGISMRPLTTMTGSGLRIHRGIHTLTAHWPNELPWLRAYRRLKDRLR